MKITTAIERIQHMEECMNRIQDALLNDTEEEILNNPLLVQKLLELNQYMTSGQWLSDYELDEKGLLPETLKRGVLSQDSLYNLLSCFDNYKEQAENSYYFLQTVSNLPDDADHIF